MTMTAAIHPVEIGALRLAALLGLPRAPIGLVIFAHGSGSGRFSPRNAYVAEGLQHAGLATLLLDLLTPDEERDRANVFDIGLLADGLEQATDWAAAQPPIAALPIGYFGASTGAAAALVAAVHRRASVRAIVSRGGRPDLAGEYLPRVKAPTLLLVGSLDVPVITLNGDAHRLLHCEKRMILVPGATHLFEEPGTLDTVIRHAVSWFNAHLPNGRA
jgi:pimeloyl-ACP methyl ester carboxylesterase